ncbi:ATP synthase subunit I [Alcanivorax sp. 521-1]|uniref:ATP synthase subunit I n=2 Tax=Alloalcanivorax profundimaris TaxID=2735259 RepID=A0ABS0ALE6_9GAMM|nr:ATP synthase subunit I [Alloalcanivorax profundimaris]
MRAQISSAILFAALVTVLAGASLGLAAAWGGTISLIAYAWGGFQVWLHPGNRAPERMAGAALRAEAGKVVIMLALFGLTFAKVPGLRELTHVVVLFLGFLLAQIAGWVQVARLDRRLGTGPDGQDD